MSATTAADSLQALAALLRSARGLRNKQDIQTAVAALGRAIPAATQSTGATLAVGDDCAAIPDGDGFLLFAIEGFLSEFVAAEPWFAGWCGVMVNLSDIAAMGGRPLAVVDALWSAGEPQAIAIMEGMRAASLAYDVPVVGGHSNTHAATAQLAVAVVGRARKLLTSFDVADGDCLMMAVDLRGHWHDPYPFFDAATDAPGERLRADLSVLPELAEAGVCRAAKDISMAGIVGTAAMLMESSGLGGVIDLDAVPIPDLLPDEFLRWLQVFPSFGYLLAVHPKNTDTVRARFEQRDLACAVIGHFDSTRTVRIARGTDEAEVWDLARTPLTGCVPPAATLPP